MSAAIIGTLSGTALSMSSNLKYLKHNDIVEVEIEKLGKSETELCLQTKHISIFLLYVFTSHK